MARILVVDDESDMRMALTNVLSRLGHEVSEAGDGPSALEFLSKEGADVVLLDMRLPGMDGLQILRSLRETDQKTPVIMVTGYGSVESAVEVMQLGAAHYLAKPFSNQELIETVERVLHGGKLPDRVGVLGRRLAEKVRGGLVPGEPSQSELPVPAAAAPVSDLDGTPGWMWGLGLGLAAGLLALGLYGFHAARLSGRDFPTTHSHHTGFAWSGKRLFVSDWVTQMVQEYALKGGRLDGIRAYRLPGTHLTGIAVGGGHIYVCDSWKRRIEKRKLDEDLTLVRRFPSPGPSPAGLFWDGRYLWSSDSSRGRIYRHEPKGLSVLESYRAPGRSPSSIYTDGKFFWSADSETRLIYRHRLDSKLRVLAAYTLGYLDEGPAPLSAFTLRGDIAWLGKDGSAGISSRPLAAFKEHSKRDLK